MGKLLNEEISESKKPLILISTNNSILQELFFDEFSDKLSLLYISDASPKNESSETYHIKTSDVNLIEHLEEKINYAVVLFEKENDKEKLSHLLKKISIDDTKAVFLFPAQDYKNFIDVMLEVGQIKNIIPALYGNVLEQEGSESEFLKIIRMAIENEKIKLSGNELMPVFPISSNDLLICIKQLLFSHKPHALYYLFYKNPQSLLSAIHYLARIEPELVFEVNHENKIESFEERSLMDQFLSDKLNLRIHYLDNHLKGFTHAIENLKFKEVKSYEIPSSKKNRRFKLPKINLFRFTPSVPLALFISLIAFIFINAVFLTLGIIFLRSSIYAFEENDFTKAKGSGVVAKSVLSIPMPTLRIIESTISYIPFLEKSYKALNLITNTADLAATSAELIQKLDDIKAGIRKSDFEKIIVDTQYLYHTGSRTLLNQENRAISNLLKPEISKSISLVSILPHLLGYSEEKEYLLLFMNNAELRPIGGFIGSVGRLIIQNGKIKDFSIQDVYDLDGQLTRHIEPHYIVRRNLQPHLYLRDSNFDLDFQRSASTSAMIYQLESGNKPDGVVAVDFTIIQKVLEIIGPVNLPNYNQTLSSENSLEFLQETIEDTNFAGSTQKKELLTQLFTSIMLEIEKKPEHLLSIGLKIPELLEQKHILLSYQSPDIQSLLSALNFGGKIPVRENINNKVIYDTVGFNEANIGVNKVNKKISRSIFYEADLSKRLAKAKISLRNESESDNYKAYLRLIAPRNSILRNVLVNGVEVETIEAVTNPRMYEAVNFSPAKGVYEIETTDDYLKTIFGTVVEVEKGKVLTVEFEYTNPAPFLEDGKDIYNLYVIKQAGTYITPSSFSIKFPDGFSASGDSISSYGQGVVKLENNLETDLNYEINFSKE
jgi:hypothetical protein